MKRRILAFSSAIVGAAYLAPVLWAGNESNPVDQGGQVAGGLSGASNGGGGSLPFTGLNLAFLIVGGLVLIATGLLLRRRRSGAAG
jgi:hypothetical protein